MVDLSKVQARSEQLEAEAWAQAALTQTIIPARLEKRTLASRVVFQFDQDTGWYTGPGVSRESPREIGVFYSPPNSTPVQPPLDLPTTEWPHWNGSQWQARLIPEDKKGVLRDLLISVKKFLLSNPLIDFVIKR